MIITRPGLEASDTVDIWGDVWGWTSTDTPLAGRPTVPGASARSADVAMVAVPVSVLP